MRLLNVHTLEFVDVYRTPDIYAVASHRWSAGNEVMLYEVRNGSRKDKTGWKKVEGFANFVKTHFSYIDLLWIDTCCVNQDSDREVSEAVNSMYRWYSQAEVCLAYLGDVENPKDIKQFSSSEWFCRGWTLQELLAPHVVIFISRDWETIGHTGPNRTKTGWTLTYGDWPLEYVVAGVTKIPELVIHDYATNSSHSAHAKFAWMEGRETSREEDMIYSMFGLFDIVLPVMYGETAERAKRRLLKEIGEASQPGIHLDHTGDVNAIRNTSQPNTTGTFSTDPALPPNIELPERSKSQPASTSIANLVTAKLPNLRISFITATDQAKFEQLFESATNGEQVLSSEKAKELLRRSKLDDNSLAQIWKLSDTRKSGQLLFPEFALAMYLCNLKITRNELPATLPVRITNEISSLITLQSFKMRKQALAHASTVATNDDSRQLSH